MARQKRRICKLGQDDLSEVITVQEAARLVHISTRGIIYHLEHGNINGRATDRVYLVSRKSLLRYYGLNNSDNHQQNS
jgi:hypothetical protein